MALQTANQFQLAPDFGAATKGFAQGQQLGQQFRQGERQQQVFNQSQADRAKSEAGEVRRANFNTAISGQTAAQNIEDRRENVNLTKSAIAALNIDPANRQDFLLGERERFINEGRTTANIDRLLDMSPEERDKTLQMQRDEGTAIEGLFSEQESAQAAAQPSALEAAKTGKLIAETKQIGKPVFKQGDAGTVFNPTTGESAVNPVVAERLDKAAQKANQTGKLDFKDRQGLNKDVTSLLKNTVEINNTAKDLEKLGGKISGPASIAIVFKFMKALDPTSVVREGEFATAENSAGIPEGIGNIYNKLINGERLGDRQIQQFIQTAQSLSNSAVENSDNQIRSFLDTFGDTVPEDLKKRITNRIPKSFKADEPRSSDTGSVFTPTLTAQQRSQQAQAGAAVPPSQSQGGGNIQVSPNIQSLLDKYSGGQ